MESIKLPNERIHYIDAAETVAIFLVVFCHFTATLGTSVVANVALQFSTVVAVPLFFMANGTLLFSHSFDLKKHLKKTLFVFISIVVWKLAYLFVILLWKHSFASISFYTVFQYLCGQNILDPYVPSEHFWFMYALLGVYLIFPILKLSYDENKSSIKYLAVLLIFAIPVVTELNEYVPNWSVGTIVSSTFPFSGIASYILMFILGPFINEYVQQNMRTKIICLLVSLVSFCVLILQKYLQVGALDGQWIRLDNDYQRLFTLVLAASLYGMFASIKFTNNRLNNVLAFVSIRTMNIYCAHMMFCYAYEVFIFPLFPYSNVGIHIIRTLLVMLVSVLIIEPFTYIPGLRKIMCIRPAHNAKVFHNKSGEL